MAAAWEEEHIELATGVDTCCIGEGEGTVAVVEYMGCTLAQGCIGPATAGALEQQLAEGASRLPHSCSWRTARERLDSKRGLSWGGVNTFLRIIILQNLDSYTTMFAAKLLNLYKRTSDNIKMSFKSAFHLPFACLFTFSIFLTLNTLCALASDPIDRRLAYVIDITRHGSRAPKYQDDLNATEVYYEEPEGEITPLGQRQLYLRGREIRRRYIDQTYFLKAQYDPEELEVHSAFTQRCLASAQSFLLGLYPPGTAEPYNPKIDSFPPFSLDNQNVELQTEALPFNYQSLPIRTNFDRYPDLFQSSFEDGVCPLFQETIQYELQNNKKLNDTITTGMRYIAEHILIPKLGFSPNDVAQLDEQDFKHIIEELDTNERENRYHGYSELTLEEKGVMDQYLMDYLYKFMYGNDMLNRIMATEFFKYLLIYFEQRAKIMVIGKTDKGYDFHKLYSSSNNLYQ